MINRDFNGEKLKSARLYNGWTLQELSDRTEISKQSISLYENGRNVPEYERVRLMAKTLGFPFEYFFGEDPIRIETGTTYFRSFASATNS